MVIGPTGLEGFVGGFKYTRALAFEDEFCLTAIPPLHEESTRGLTRRPRRD